MEDGALRFGRLDWVDRVVHPASDDAAVGEHSAGEDGAKEDNAAGRVGMSVGEPTDAGVKLII